MRRDLTIKTGSMGGTSDFRVVAPIKKGFVPALDAVTYKTRVKRVLRTLHVGRLAAHENELARVLSDAVERVGRIHSVGIAVLEPEDKVLLTVTFDGAWEAYVRVIWQKVARLLDLIFCNTENYVLGYENSYEKWGTWLKQAQSDALFLYATPGLTVDDTRYLRMEDRVYRREAGDSSDLRVTRMKIPTTEQIALQSLLGKGGPIGTDPTNAGFGIPLVIQKSTPPPFRHGVRSVVGLYRLADVYPPDTPDGIILQRAAHELLPEFLQMMGDGTYQTGIDRAMARFEEAMLWFQQVPSTKPVARSFPVPLQEPPPLKDLGNVQAGIIQAYPDVDHGCLLLLQFETPAALAAFLETLPVNLADETLKAGDIATNIAFTVEGLRAAGLSDDEVRSLPDEFVQGMERRAGLLGDVRWNHPRRWRLPAHNWSLGVNAPDLGDDDTSPRIDLGAVHAVVQVRLIAGDASVDARAKLMAALEAWVAVDNGVKPLSLQWTQRQRDAIGNVVEHFGFVESLTNPVLRRSEAGTRFSNQVHLGEVLCGYPNRADHAGAYDEGPDYIRSLLRDGSFLALRKLRQDVQALDDALTAAAPAGAAVTREELMAKMMGRWPAGHPKAGEPLAAVSGPNPLSNDFHFDGDPQGTLCPLHAHIRRANPRIRAAEEGSRPARIFRRGMSYGSPPVQDTSNAERYQASLKEERGIIFMAYNASLGEQFEVVQSWLAGGNSTASYSGESDPFLGLSESGRPRYFRFEQNAKSVRVALDGSDILHEEPRPFVRLEWGIYLFAPSRNALDLLQQRAAAQGSRPRVTWSKDVGEAEIRRLREIELRLGEAEAALAWKTVLEDPDAAADFTSASIWAAIRENHGGVLRTPFGVLVGERSLVEQVFKNQDRNLTITGYLPRMRRSFGVLYLGLDPDQADSAYERESAECNRAIMDLDRPATFLLARESTHRALQKLVDETIEHAREDGDTRWDLTVDARELLEPLLADFCEEWFGLSEQDDYFRRAGYRWDWTKDKPPNYPGHFLSPSRYIFQPHPGPEVESIGSAHGVAVRNAMIGFLDRFGSTITAPVTHAVINSPQGKADTPFAARTIAGAMMGFIPTVEGNLRRVLNEFLREGTLWSLRARFSGTEAKDFTDACNRLGADFIPAMQLRAVPELIWRTVTASHTLGQGDHQVTVTPGDIIVAGAVSATQQSLKQGRSDLYHAFGGNRRAAGHPTHACPGADPALALMMGFFSALVESKMPLRAGPGPLTIGLDGKLPPPAEARIKLRERGLAPLAADFEMPEVAAAKATATPLVAIGDSWLFDQWFITYGEHRPNLVNSLLSEGYKDLASGTQHQFTAAGRRLDELANSSFLTEVTNYLNDEPGLKAILLDGGGNDVVKAGAIMNKPLFKMLNPRNQGGAPLNEAEVAAFIDGTLFNNYTTVINALTAATPLPILAFAYDHPAPDGRGENFLGFPVAPWLKPVFVARGYDIKVFPTTSPDLTLAQEVMKALIDRLNAMLARVAAAHPNVHHVNLTGTLAAQYGAPANYAQLWANELHPKKDGFDLLAKVIARKLKELGV